MENYLDESPSLQIDVDSEPASLSLEDILQGLQSYQEDSGLPRGVLEEAIARRDDITPHLLEWLSQAVAQELAPGDDWLKVNFALYLLAQFQEPRAYPLILDLLRLSSEDLDLLLSDSLTEDGRRFLVSTYDGDWEGLVRLAEDEAADEFCRSAALGAMSGLLHAGRVERSLVLKTWKDLMQRWTEANRPDLHEHPLSSLAVEVARHRLSELRPELEAALSSNSFDPTLIAPEEVLERLESQDADPGFFDQWRHYQPITDVLAEFGSWPYFMTPAERQDVQKRQDEKFALLREQLFRENPEAARRLFGLGVSEFRPAQSHSGARKAKKKKRKQERAARKKNRR